MATRRIRRPFGGGLSRAQVLNLLNQQGGGAPVIEPELFSLIALSGAPSGTTTTLTFYAHPLAGTWTFDRLVSQNVVATYPTISNVVVTPSTATVMGRIEFDVTVPAGYPREIFAAIFRGPGGVELNKPFSTV